MAALGRAKLNKDIEKLNSLLDFDYHKPIWAKLIRSALNKTNFNGVTVSGLLLFVVFGITLYIYSFCILFVILVCMYC